MSFLSKWIGLPGASTTLQEAPQICPHCASKHFYIQPDFKRSLGLAFVSVASVLTFVLMYMGYDWWIIWSPMFVILIMDRGFAWTRPLILICYQCEHIFRGIPQDQVQKFEAFDLELHDRIHYSDKSSQ